MENGRNSMVNARNNRVENKSNELAFRRWLKEQYNQLAWEKMIVGYA